MQSFDNKYMLRALELAEKGRGSVSPNPMVGAVIVNSEGKIIGEGYHERYGEPHAEVNAVRSVEDKSQLATSTIYVTLEPCSHFGKTPPCADLIVSEGIGRVVVGCYDPNPKVSGRGIAKIEAAGIEVITGIEEDKCRNLNCRFMTAQEKKRPYVILKWAQTSDGFIDTIRPVGTPAAWFTGSEAKKMVHQWRADEDAILVGRNTALMDNPSLTVREVEGKNPTRVVLSQSGALDNSLNLFDGQADTIVVTAHENTFANARTRVIDFTENVAQKVLDVLLEERLQSVIIEGGAQTLRTFLDAGLWDEARIFTAEHPLSYYYPEIEVKEIAAPKMADHLHPEGLWRSTEIALGSDSLVVYHK